MKLLTSLRRRFTRREALPLAPSPLYLFDPRALRSGERWHHEATIRGASQVAYLGNDVAMCRVLGRYKMCVDTDDAGLATHLMLEGYWEMWSTEAIVRMVQPGMVALDIGANCGYFTLLMADLVGPEGRVLAFEPNPPTLDLLRRNVSLNGYDSCVTVHDLALSDIEGYAAFSVPPHEPKNARIVPAGHDPGAIGVPTARLDAVADTLDADFIKIDAEGGEEAIWRGMTGLLEQDRPLTILLEFTPNRYASAAAFVDEIASHGFSLSVVDPFRGIRPTSRAEILAEPGAVDQMLLLRRGWREPADGG